MRNLLVVGLFACASFSSSVSAQQATPNHVYQVTDEIKAELALLHDANFTSPPRGTASVGARLPRHVYQKARQVYQRVQLLRYINGLTTGSLEASSGHAIKPADVRILVRRTLDQLRELKSAYQIAKRVEERPLPSGKKPSDVYANLIEINLSLTELGLPAVTPNEVEQAARTIVAEMSIIAAAVGVQRPIDEPATFAGKTPNDVFEAGRGIILALEALSARNPRFEPTGGFLLEPSIEGKKTPSDVLDLLGRLIADLEAVKVAMGLTKTVPPQPFEGGKTPSDVYAQLVVAKSIIDRIGG